MDQISFFKPFSTNTNTLKAKIVIPKGITNWVKYNGVAETDSETICIS